MTNLLIVDDHEIVRAGIKRLVENTPNLNIVADLGSGEEAYQFLHKNTVDLIIMDVSMPGKGGIETTNQIKKRYPKIKIFLECFQFKTHIIYSTEPMKWDLRKCLLENNQDFWPTLL